MAKKIGIGLILLIVGFTWFGGCIRQGEIPRTPTGLVVVREEYDPANEKYGDKMFLSWEHHEAPDLDGYLVYRSYERVNGRVDEIDAEIDAEKNAEKTEYVVIATTCETSHVDEDLSISWGYPSTIYYYRVSAFNIDGFESPLSEEVSIEYTPYD